ncbi:MAG: hypothetical protein N2442_14650 [Spirochaetes bacterium]|nr:hypothetical protein [Spirochaetota bacterium]
MLKQLGKKFKQWVTYHPLLSITLGGFLLVGFLGTGVFLPGPSRWKGYYLVLLDGKADLAQTILQLKTAGFHEVLSSVTAPVLIQSFSHLESVYVSQLRTRLQPEDPRFDGFLSKIERVFQTESSEGHVVYLPIHYHPLYVFYRLSTLLPDRKCLLADWDFYRSLGLLVLFILFVLFQTIRTSTYRWAKILTGIPWVPVILQGNLMGFILTVWCYQVFSTILDSLWGEVEQYLYYHKRTGIDAIISKTLNHFVLMAGVLVLIADTSVIIGIVFGSVLSLGIGMELILVQFYHLNLREHRIFLPLPILPSHWKETKRSVLYGSLILISVAPLLYMMPIQGGQQQIPSPRGSTIHRFWGTRSAYRDLWVLHKKDPLPNLSDFMVHVKYQREFPYGATYEFPSPEEELSYPRFREEGGKLTFWNETIVRYDKTWYNQTLHGAKKDKLGNLFYRQGARITVWEPIFKRLSGTQLLIYYTVVILVATASYRIRMPLMHKPIRWILGVITRRKQQEA